ncbi:MAG: hypothetical protein HY849_06535 [Nitrosomonadales bacterium]|nr:hypothetical protein [Nitrosomonadales bacterium]
MANKVFFVRVNAKTGEGKFFRCGLEFSREWREVEADEATANRLREEQMLEVSDVSPSASDSAPSVPTDPAGRVAAIKDVIASLDKSNADLWLGSGAPKVSAIEAVTGWTLSGAERDAAWSDSQAAQ